MFGFLKKIFHKRYGGDKRYYRMLDEIFGISPNNIELYKLALIHRSASQLLPDGTPINNERLEFLGDAVLETIVSDYIFVEYPEGSEGFLTQMRSRIVSRVTLNELCVKIGLSEYIQSNSGGCFVQKHLHGDALEAMIGAMYLDKGYNYTNRLIISMFSRHLDLDGMITTETDFKSRLIEWCQKSKHTINFVTDFGEGSTSQHPVFRSVAVIDGMEVGYGFGASKKEAEQRAAYSVSQALDDVTGDNILDMVDKSLNGGSPAKKIHRKSKEPS